MNTKKCNQCKKNKLLEEFYKRKDRNAGVQSICKVCDKRRCFLWRIKNKKKWNSYIKIYRRKYKKLRKKLDPKYHLDEVMGNAIYSAIHHRKKGHKWESFVNYTLIDLMKHLEKQFKFWMSWNNYGKYNPNKRTWQIDHIIPKIQFNYTSFNDSNFKRCWALKNLQPLETIKNLKKRKK